eukprot:191239-Amphidinium_carterae.1
MSAKAVNYVRRTAAKACELIGLIERNSHQDIVQGFLCSGVQVGTSSTRPNTAYSPSPSFYADLCVAVGRGVGRHVQ